jgi:hypothetical protein
MFSSKSVLFISAHIVTENFARGYLNNVGLKTRKSEVKAPNIVKTRRIINSIVLKNQVVASWVE